MAAEVGGGGEGGLFGLLNYRGPQIVARLRRSVARGSGSRVSYSARTVKLFSRHGACCCMDSFRQGTDGRQQLSTIMRACTHKISAPDQVQDPPYTQMRHVPCACLARGVWAPLCPPLSRGFACRRSHPWPLADGDASPLTWPCYGARQGIPSRPR